ncbi:MAG: transcriptional coactivator p15/PC4 family protein [archaeon]
MDEKEYGRIKKSGDSEIVIRVSNFKDVDRVDIREFVKTEKYTGFTKKGISLPLKQLNALRQLLACIQLDA